MAQIIKKLSPINQFIKFQKDFDILLKELINEYEKLKNYFLRILYIKNISENEDKNKKEKIEMTSNYSNKHLIKGMKEVIHKLKNTILIKEEYPEIKNNIQIVSKSNKELISSKKDFLDLNNINKDFEYFNSKINNLSIKKIITFELTDNNEISNIRDRKLFKLNTSKEPSCFIYTYTERSQVKNNSYIKVYNHDLKLLFTKFIYGQKIKEIIQLSNNFVLLILSKSIEIIKIDINNNSIDVVQEITKKTNFYFELLLNNDDSLLIPLKSKNYFYLKNNVYNTSNKYIEQNVSIESPLLNENIYLIKKDNFINVNTKEIYFYNVDYNYNKNQKKYDIKIIKNAIIKTKSYLNQGIYFINKDIFIISSLNYIYLISFPYKELISIISYYSITRIIHGYNNDCYLLLDQWFHGHKILRQINLNDNNDDKNFERGELLVDGQTYLKDLDYYNRYCLIDLEDIICYIKINEKEEYEIEYGTQYKKK